MTNLEWAPSTSPDPIESRSAIGRLLQRSVLLPEEISTFESAYLARVNRIALYFFALHIPAFTLIAFLNHTGWFSALALSSATFLGPAVASAGFSGSKPRLVSVIHGITAMLMGGLLVHFGQGEVQVEMHFYFFSLLAMLVIFANPMVIVAAAVTVALHHLVLFLLLPASLLNYAAPLWVVAVHAGFVVLESVACVFIARATFNNMVRLERQVIKRTQQVENKTRDLRLVLDHVEQGLVTIGLDGRAIVSSAAFEQWFGAIPDESTETVFVHLGRKNERFGIDSSASWMQVQMDMLPLDLTLQQMPSRLTVDSKHFAFRYLPIEESEASLAGPLPQRYLVVVSDITSEVARERAELERREGLVLFEAILGDPQQILEYHKEGDRLLDEIVNGQSISRVGRALHTLKGNSALMGIRSVENLCHTLETTLADTEALCSDAALEELRVRWTALSEEMDRFLGARTGVTFVNVDDIARLETAVLSGASRDTLLLTVHQMRLEPTEARLKRFAEQLTKLGNKLERAPLDIVVESNSERVDGALLAPFWSAFAHLVRNAVDHGCETLDERLAKGKREHITIGLRTFGDGQTFNVEISDDGRGIDWSKLAERAVGLGLPSKSRRELVEALFADGLSTTNEITETSGRGIGMGAVREIVSSLGGAITIESEYGHGTTVRVAFPRRKVLSLPETCRGDRRHSLSPTSTAA